MPFFSIIIPTYNSEKTLKKCLESVQSQSFDNFEILIMDGVSTDRTLEIGQSFNDSRIKIFSERDKGVYDAMNKGIDLAIGDWFYFLGSDDELSDEKVLGKIYDEIIQGAYDFIYGNVLMLKTNSIHTGEVDRICLMTHKNICHQSIFYNKELFKRLGKYSLEFKIWADWDFNVRCFSHPEIRIKYVDLLIAKYNDFDGLSAQFIVDEKFINLLPLNIKTTRAIEDFKKNSREFTLGNQIFRVSKLFKYIKSLFKR